MPRAIFLLIYFFMTVNIAAYSNEIDYSNCESIQGVIERETREIHKTNPADHDELAELYVSRGESYLLAVQYEKAVEDFQNAHSHLARSYNIEAAVIVAFRAAFGEAIGYDNLGMQENTQQAIEQLHVIANHIGCNNCAEHRPCKEMISSSVNKFYFRNIVVNCAYTVDKQDQQIQDDYKDIIGPTQPPDLRWCEEVVTGVGRAMDAIACLAPNYPVRVVLIGIIEALITRGVKCCEAGGFWKACVAPIARKWKEWKNNKENHIPPNAKNLPLYNT